MRLVPWLKPPRSLLILLFLLAAASISSLAWFGSKLLRQESAVQSQQAQERLEQSADRVAARFRSNIAQLHKALAAGTDPSLDRKDFLLLQTGDHSFSTHTHLLYWPAQAAVNGSAAAAAWYGCLSITANSALHAGALLRQARVYRNLNRLQESAADYRLLVDLNTERGLCGQVAA
jgi:hypothetical protein